MQCLGEARVTSIPVSLLLIAAMAGIMLFFTIAIAPTVFKVLPQQWASTYIRAFFPKYYGVLGLISILAAWLGSDARTSLVSAICALLFFICLWGLTPCINRARDQWDKKTFSALHALSVVINLAQLAAFLWVLS